MCDEHGHLSASSVHEVAAPGLLPVDVQTVDAIQDQLSGRGQPTQQVQQLTRQQAGRLLTRQSSERDTPAQQYSKHFAFASSLGIDIASICDPVTFTNDRRARSNLGIFLTAECLKRGIPSSEFFAAIYDPNDTSGLEI